MKFNLNQIKDEYLNKSNLLKYVSEYDIYAYYLGIFDIGKTMSSPFREDSSPSFGVFIGNKGDLCYNDYLLGGGDCIAFVMYMEFCTYYQALSILNNRYNVGLFDTNKKIESKYNHTPLITNKTVIKKSDVSISIKVRSWQLYDKEYWSKYEISSHTLEWFDVYPIEYFWINYRQFKAEQYAYAYRYDKNIYKIYQPFLDVKDGKFWSNIKNKEIYQGHNQLPDKGEILFITSSLKDVIVLYEIGFNAVAPHTEHQILSDELYKEYSSRFDVIIILYDNDNAGQKHANKMVDKYGLKSIQIPDTETKDPSDFVEKYDLLTLKEWIQQSV